MQGSRANDQTGCARNSAASGGAHAPRGLMTDAGQAAVVPKRLDLALLAPRGLVFLLLAVVGYVEQVHGHIHWLVLACYALGTVAVAVRPRGRALARYLDWSSTLLDAALAVFLIGEHGDAIQGGSLPSRDVINLLPAFLFLLQSGLTLDLRRTIVLALLVAVSWGGLLLWSVGHTAELGYQLYGLFAFAIAALFVIDGVQRLKRAVDLAVRAEAEQVRLAHFLPSEAAISRVGQEGGVVEARHVAMLALDVRGFSELTQACGAQTVVPWLLTVRAIVNEATSRHGGFVDKYLGDGILSHFLGGLPQHQAEAALRAALEMRGRLARWNERRLSDGLPVLRTTIALHAGEVLAGVFDDGLRAEFTVLGPAMNALSRIERRAKEENLDLLASKRFARLLPSSWKARLRVTRLPRRSEHRDAPDIVRLDEADSSALP